MKTNVDFTEIRLSELSPGLDAVVCRVEDESPSCRRLQELGLLPDTPVRIVRRAPLGDPVELEIRGYRLCIRRSDAAHVWVRWNP